MNHYETTFRHFFAGTGGRYLAVVAAVIIGGSIIVTLYQSVQLLLTSYDMPLPSAPAASTAPKLPPLWSDLADWHLFGLPPELEDSGKPLPKTTLQLSLQGVMHATNPKNSQAIIADSSGKAKVYVMGDDLPGGATLDEVLTHSVVLKHNGKREELSLPKQALNFSSPGKPLFESSPAQEKASYPVPK